MKTYLDKLKAPLSRKNIAHFIRHERIALLIVLLGFIGGVVWMSATRYLLVRPQETHYHANFAVYINGVREEFKESTYYEEVAACTSEYGNNPKGRVHMHEQVNDVIHVHDKRVTYGHFLQNIGWTVGRDVLANLQDTFVASDESPLVFILNGERVTRIDNRMIENLDQLLISYGTNDSTLLEQQFQSVARTAAEVNKYHDPASCGGLNGRGHDSFMSRLKRATFW